MRAYASYVKSIYASYMKLRDGMVKKRSETMQENRVKLIAAARKAFAERVLRSVDG